MECLVWHKSQDKENLGMASKHTHNKEVNWCSTSLDLDEEGKDVLPALIAEHKEEYEKLSHSKIKEIVHLYKEHKATKATVWGVSIWSRINKNTQTLMVIETEVSKILRIIDLTNSNATPKAANLQAQSGVEISNLPHQRHQTCEWTSTAMQWRRWINF